MAIIDEQWCIGCTLCLKACPVDAIVGANKTMHTVLEAACTGCELCIPVCPVDCISLEPITGNATGWQAWSDAQAQEALSRYVQRADRLGLTVGAQQAPLHQRRQRTRGAADALSVMAPTASSATEHTAPAATTAEPQTAPAGSTAAPSKAALLAGILKKAQAKRLQ